MQVVPPSVKRRTTQVRNKLDEVFLGFKHPKVRRLMEKMANQGAKIGYKPSQSGDYDLTTWLAETILRRSEKIKRSINSSRATVNKLRAISNQAKRTFSKKIRKVVKVRKTK